MQLLTGDMETYYSKEYSLSKKGMTTEKYVRDPQFEIIGFSAKVGNKPAKWLSTEWHPFVNKLHSMPWNQIAFLSHNGFFDGFILSQRLGIIPGFYFDTLSMGRALHGTEVGNSLGSLSKFYGVGEKGDEVIQAMGKRRADFTPYELAKYGEYCCNDTELCHRLFKKMAPHFSPDEFEIINITMQMFCDPRLVLDRDILTANLINTRQKKIELMDRWQQLLQCTAAEFKARLMSNPQFADLLRQCGIEPPVKISLTTKKETYAFAKSDEGMKELLAHEKPAIQALAAARVGAKSTLEETRSVNLIEMSERGLTPIQLSYYGAHTGRYSGAGGLNFQNVPRKSRINYAIKAPEGFVICAGDSAQVEARLNVWNAGQDNVVRLYRDKQDVYKHMATSIYNVSLEEVDFDKRFVAKQVVLGCGFQMGPDRFEKEMKKVNVPMPWTECDRIIGVYRATNNKVAAFWEQCKLVVECLLSGSTGLRFGRNDMFLVEKDAIRLPNGMQLRYPNMRKIKIDNPDYPDKSNRPHKTEIVYDFKKGRTLTTKRIYSGLLCENLIQAIAFIIIKYQMLLIHKRYKIVLNRHDDIAALARIEEAQEALSYLLWCMHQVPDWAEGAPIAAEGNFGASLGDLK